MTFYYENTVAAEVSKDLRKSNAVRGKGKIKNEIVLFSTGIKLKGGNLKKQEPAFLALNQ
ncbi:hypothetical protein MM300_08300 [Evansella sp. LMS18]|uniref:hypothetical protein n=1 Tax=Evansella sp. LMS18 TaxID=2924033 RepID=UPI0020D184FF|nr:hypothetical protein [Evansella sp. LMS18]UTR12276.1 hypothetical protein MM300_08300 [Evansella sp. LMS18]